MRKPPSTLGFATALLVGVFLGQCTVFAADTAKQVSVSASCSRMAVPDRASITVTADFTDPEMKTAVRKSTQAYERVREAVLKLGLENLEVQTSEYTVQEAREWEKNKSVLKGYRARMGLWVSTSAVAKIGDVIALAAREGLRDVGQLSSYLSDEKLSREKASCLTEAGEAARAKAEKLAASVGAKIGEAITLSEGYSAAEPQPLAAGARMEKLSMAADSIPAPQVESARQKITVTVNAAFALK